MRSNKKAFILEVSNANSSFICMWIWWSEYLATGKESGDINYVSAETRSGCDVSSSDSVDYMKQ